MSKADAASDSWAEWKSLCACQCSGLCQRVGLYACKPGARAYTCSPAGPLPCPGPQVAERRLRSKALDSEIEGYRVVVM